MTSYKRLFSRSLAAAPDRLHFAAHSHHLWPDASFEGHLRAWEDGARLADLKWDRIFAEVLPAAQRHVARELHLPDPNGIAFASGTHDLILRLFSAKKGPLRVLTSDGEFHSFRRQAARWEQEGLIKLQTVACEPFDSFTARFLAAAAEGTADIIFVSHVMFKTGVRFDGIETLAAHARPDGPWVVVDGYHAFMALPVDLSRVADRIFYLAGGYKYAMAGEGAAFLHAPPGFGPAPVNTGWYAEFTALERQGGGMAYPLDGMRFMGATFDPSAIYRFNAVRDMLDREELTTEAIAFRLAKLREKLEAAIQRGNAGGLRDATLLRPNESGHKARYIALRHPRAAAWKKALSDRNVIVDARDDVLRIGFGLYCDEADVDRFCTSSGSALAA